MEPDVRDEEILPAQVVAERFDDFYTREYRRMVGLALALTGDSRVAEDLAQDAFIAAHRKWSEVGSYDKPAAWVRRVITNRSRSLARRARVETRALLRLASTASTVTAPSESTEEFWHAVRALPRQQATCVTLRYLEDLDVAEIAADLGCAESTVRVHLHRGRLALAQRLRLEEETS
jgi:RNA polymerase sigma-70 factor (ECF subfamily)